MTRPVRDELGGSAPANQGDTLLSLVHLSDLHILDAASPARCEWVELEARDPAYQNLLHMHRPYDALTTFALAAHLAAIRSDPIGATGRPFDLAVSTGDNIDNAQRNELDAYLALMAGGVAQLDARGCAQDHTSHAFPEPWPYWCPDERVPDRWRDRGYPPVDDFVDRASAPISSPGIGLPWTSIAGNHDLLRQGTALETAALNTIATSAEKSIRRPEGFAPQSPVDVYLDHPEEFSNGPAYPLEPNPDRRVVDRDEWLQAHIDRGALGYRHGQTGLDTAIDLEHVRLILLDTNHPHGDFEGSLGEQQLAWLDEQLAETDADAGRLAIVASHHGPPSLVNDRGADPSRLLAAPVDAVVGRHPSAVAWLLGHRHINRIDPRPGPAGGYWEISTASTIDWPSQTRSIDVVRHADGTLELICTMLDHRDEPDGLATLHRRLAERFAARMGPAMAGRDADTSVRLLLPPRSARR